MRGRQRRKGRAEEQRRGESGVLSNQLSGFVLTSLVLGPWGLLNLPLKLKGLCSQKKLNGSNEQILGHMEEQRLFFSPLPRTPLFLNASSNKSRGCFLSLYRNQMNLKKKQTNRHLGPLRVSSRSDTPPAFLAFVFLWLQTLAIDI